MIRRALGHCWEELRVTVSGVRFRFSVIRSA